MPNFLNYYNRELNYLRNSGGVFAKKYPKIGGYLQLSNDVSPDPHVERMIESFAFISAKINQKIDENFARMGEVLLDVLYPHLTKPIPAVSFADFKPVSSFWFGTDPMVIERGTELSCPLSNDIDTCYFKTVYPLKIWPIKLTKVQTISPTQMHFSGADPGKHTYLQLTFESQNFMDISLDWLLFKINGPKSIAFQVYQSILTQEKYPIFVSVDGKKSYYLGSEVLQPMGFEHDETILPVPEYSTHIYSLLQTFFFFPENFLFFKLINLDLIKKYKPSDKIHILVPISSTDKTIIGAISEKTFSITSTPIVNLFEATSDPIKVDDAKSESLLLVDQRREYANEIYSIENIFSTPDGIKQEIYEPFFSMAHMTESKAFWIAKRIPSFLRGLNGSDIFLSFVKKDNTPTALSTDTVFAKVLCTNRDLADNIDPGALLYTEAELPIEKIECMMKPRLELYEGIEGKRIWKLISQLAVNQMSFSDEKTSLFILREVIALYAKNESDYSIIDGLKKISIDSVVRRFGKEAWRGYVKGSQITLYIDLVDNPSIFLFASILRHFMAMNVSLNSFLEIRLVDVLTNEEISTWKPIPGRKLMI